MTLAERSRLVPWLLCVLAAVAGHLLLFMIQIPLSAPSHAPVEVHQVDPAQVAAIRQQWKRAEQEQSLLLSKDSSKPEDTEAPKDARYLSDRNRIVEREQRARDTDVLPKSGSPGARTHTQTDEKRADSSQNELGTLGVPFRLAEEATSQNAGAARPGEAGADQSLIDRSLPEGDQNLLNTEQSVYYSFYARLYQAIAPIWQSTIRNIPTQRRLPEGDYTTVVDVVFDQDGDLVGVNRMQGSGVPELDEAIDQAWSRIGRFPNPPSGLLDEYKQVHTGWTFTVQVGQGLGIQYLPPSRVY